jgi:low temperature requirement protein LtrA
VSDPVERRTSAVELLWDLVFVFAVTRVTTLLASHLSWAGFGRSMLVLALVWWAWSAFVWVANAQAADSPELRYGLLIATVVIFITGLALPQAFAGGAVLFATTYAAVRFIHLVLYADASRKGNASRSAIAGFAITVAIGMALLVAGALATGLLRIALWSVAVAIDYAGPAWLTRERLRGLQQVAVEHFAERYGLFVIICLGESIVVIGLGAGGYPHLDAALIAKVTLGLLITMAMWWKYFAPADDAQEHLSEHDDPVIAAADGYSYLHLAIVAGVIIFAAGAKLLVRDPIEQSLPAPARLALCAGVAIYLLGHFAFLLRLTGEAHYESLCVAAALLLLYPLSAGIPGWATAAIVLLLTAGLCAAEVIRDRRSTEEPRVSPAPPANI